MCEYMSLKDHFEYLLLLCGLQEFNQSNVHSRVPRMIEESDEMALEYLASEYMTRRLSGEHSYVNRMERISSKIVSPNVSSPRKPSFELCPNLSK